MTYVISHWSILICHLGDRFSATVSLRPAAVLPDQTIPGISFFHRGRSDLGHSRGLCRLSPGTHPPGFLRRSEDPSWSNRAEEVCSAYRLRPSSAWGFRLHSSRRRESRDAD